MSNERNGQPGECACEAVAERAAHYLGKHKRSMAVGLAILIAVATNIVDYRNTCNRELIEAEGVTVPGVITEGTHITGRRGRSHFVVSYTTQDGAVIEQRFEVTGRFFLGRTDEEFITDSRVDVRYLPGDPRNAFVVDGTHKTSYWVLAVIDVLIAIVIGGAFYYFSTLFVGFWTKRSKLQHPQSPGEAATVEPDPARM